MGNSVFDFCWGGRVAVKKVTVTKSVTKRALRRGACRIGGPGGAQADVELRGGFDVRVPHQCLQVLRQNELCPGETERPSEIVGRSELRGAHLHASFFSDATDDLADPVDAVLDRAPVSPHQFEESRVRAAAR
ncbi:MAG: hypothetical protein SH850_03475 [Planctomycetaceae bacterium]|nr:hypothetical protein [Planctomycetaceae bacterium]